MTMRAITTSDKRSAYSINIRNMQKRVTHITLSYIIYIALIGLNNLIEFFIYIYINRGLLAYFLYKRIRLFILLIYILKFSSTVKHTLSTSS